MNFVKDLGSCKVFVSVKNRYFALYVKSGEIVEIGSKEQYKRWLYRQKSKGLKEKREEKKKERYRRVRKINVEKD